MKNFIAYYDEFFSESPDFWPRNRLDLQGRCSFKNAIMGIGFN
jgi:hypothetical protein